MKIGRFSALMYLTFGGIIFNSFFVIVILSGGIQPCVDITVFFGEFVDEQFYGDIVKFSEIIAVYIAFKTLFGYFIKAVGIDIIL